jgi:tetratricopeptide (TPR) repeat protein
MTLVRAIPWKRLLVAALGLVVWGCGGGGDEKRAAGAPVESLQTTLAHAETSFRDGDYVEAQKAYESALAMDPEQSRATANLATCYLKNRMVKKAQDTLQAYLSRHPEDATARLVLARVEMRLGDLDAAAQALREVLRLHPDVVMAHYNLGHVAYRSRHYEEAEQHLKRAMELKPDLPDAHYTLGLTYLALQRYDEAIASLEKAVQVDPRHVGAHFNLANAYARAGRMQEAAREQAAYADLSGRSKSQQEKDAQIKASSVKAIQFLLDKKYPEALEEYRSLVKRFPDHAPLYTSMGQVEIMLEKRDEAFASLTKAIELDPKQSDAHYLLAGLYRARGDPQAAERELTIFAALEAIPEGKSGY